MLFLIDENVRKEVAEFLIKNGHDVKLAPRGYKNGQIAVIAKEEKRVLLTHDKHFADIFMYQPPTAENIVSSLSKFLKKISNQDIKGRLIILEKDDFRIR